jgi:mannose-1-phosphate guanylyltransferase
VKAESFVSDIISCGIYLFSKDIIRDMGRAVAERRAQYEKQVEEDPYFYSATPSDIDVVMLEQDVLRKLAGNEHLYVMIQGQDDFWMQIKAAASALPANALYLQHWKRVAPHRLARHQTLAHFPNANYSGMLGPGQPPQPTPFGTLTSRLGAQPTRPDLSDELKDMSIQTVPEVVPTTPTSPKFKEGPELIQPIIIHPSAVVHPTAKIGPNVSIAARAVIGRGVRVKDTIILDAVEVKHDSIILNSIIGRDCRIGCWSRVEGAPVDIYGAADTGGATINGMKDLGATVLGRDVKVADEVVIRNCIVLPNKELKGSFQNEILM